MKEVMRILTILRILDRGPIYKTKLHEIVNSLQQSADLGYTFKHGLRGLFAQDLENDLHYLAYWGLLQMQYDPNKRDYLIIITSDGKEFLNKYGMATLNYIHRMD